MSRIIRPPTLSNDESVLMNVVKIICSCFRLRNNLNIRPTLKARITYEDALKSPACYMRLCAQIPIKLAATIKKSKMWWNVSFFSKVNGMQFSYSSKK